MPKAKNPPLPIGTPVAIDIAQGLSVARGTITAAEYDDGWMYRIDITGGDCISGGLRSPTESPPTALNSRTSSTIPQPRARRACPRGPS
jgi:hypothetical protein